MARKCITPKSRLFWNKYKISLFKGIRQYLHYYEYIFSLISQIVYYDISLLVKPYIFLGFNSCLSFSPLFRIQNSPTFKPLSAWIFIRSKISLDLYPEALSAHAPIWVCCSLELSNSYCFAIFFHFLFHFLSLSIMLHVYPMSLGFLILHIQHMNSSHLEASVIWSSSLGF